MRRVVVEQPRLDDYLARADTVLQVVRAKEAREADEQHQARLKVMIMTALLLVSLVVAGFVAFAMPESNRLFTSGVAVSLALGAVAVAGRGLRPLLRPG